MSLRRESRSGTSRRQEPDSITKNAAASLASQLTTASLTALLIVFLVRALGTKEYGLFALTMGVGATALAFADVGISFSTARFVAEHRGRDSELRAFFADALKLKVVVTGLVCALLAALSSVIAGIYREPDLVWPLRVMALATFGQSTFMMVLGVSIARGRTIVNVRLVAAESLLEVSASVALVLAGAGALGAVVGRAIGYVLGATIAALVVLRLTGNGPMRFMSLPRRDTVRRISGYARAMFAIDASYTITASLSVLILGAYAGSAASGTYQAPVRLITLITYVGLSVSAGVGPRLARSTEREPDVAALQKALRGMIDFQCLFLAPAIVWAKPITHLLLGPGYARSADVLVFLAPYIFFSGLAPLVTISVNYMGEAQRRVPIALATLCVAAAAGFLLIPRHGVIGAAIATDIAFGFYTLAHIWLCRGLLRLRMETLVWSLVCGLTAAFAMGIVLASVGTEHLTFGDWVIGALGGVGAYVSMLIFTREIRGVHLAGAAAIVGGRFAHRGEAGREPYREPPMLPRHAGAAAPRPIVASVTDDTKAAPAAASKVLEVAPLEVIEETAAEVVKVSPAEVVEEPASEVEPGSKERPSERIGVLGNPRRRLAVARAQAAVHPETDSADVAVEGRSPAAMPPAWAEGWMHEPVALGHASAAPGSQARDGPDLAPRAHRAEAKSSVAGPAGVAPGSGSTDVMYQIAWRLESDAGVFELRPAALSPPSDDAPGDAPATGRSAPVPWAWRMPPAPTPEARRAHDALVERLVSGGWRRAGIGDAWFADRFCSPGETAPSGRVTAQMPPQRR